MQEVKDEPEAAQIYNLRREFGLPQLVKKTRTCLYCNEKFTSEGAHNRKCEKCKAGEKE